MQDQSNSHTIGTIPKELPLETPFWQFSLSIWKHPDAQASLLFLQDEHHLKVNRLLFCSWLGFERRSLLVDVLENDALLAQWSDHTVTPLRTIRKQLKGIAPFQPQLKATIQSAELQAEQIEQALLFLRVEHVSRPSKQQNTLQTLSFNLSEYTTHALKSQVCLAELTPHLVTLIQAAIPNHERKHIETYFK